MKQFLLYGHGGAFNHGAEAITRQTIQIIRDKYPGAHIVLSTHFPEQDAAFSIGADVLVPPDPPLWNEEKRAPAGKKPELARRMYAEALSYITADTTLLSVGGDNFCYPSWYRLSVFQERARAVGARSLLWGCSIEPSGISPEMLDTLHTYHTILVRESLTEEALRNHGVKAEIRRIPDIAFGLEPASVPLSKRSRTLVGVNFSPLIERQETSPGVMIDAMRRLVTHILRETGSDIALIPHVLMPMDNDAAALSALYDSLPDREKPRVWLAGDHLSAAQYKYIISRCDVFVASRTHASIAAYASGVPCLVIGYSVKSEGIARDLDMGEYVISVRDIRQADDITGHFARLWRERNTVKRLLREKLPDYLKMVTLYDTYC